MGRAGRQDPGRTQVVAGPGPPREAAMTGKAPAGTPLADRMRPRTFDEFVGQERVVGPGTVLRREKTCWALIVGGLLGVSLRLVTNIVLFDDPFYFKAGYKLDLGSLLERLPLYLLAVLVFVPGGFVLTLCYRGRRRLELIASVTLFVLAMRITHISITPRLLPTNSPRTNTAKMIQKS